MTALLKNVLHEPTTIVVNCKLYFDFDASVLIITPLNTHGGNTFETTASNRRLAPYKSALHTVFQALSTFLLPQCEQTKM